MRIKPARLTEVLALFPLSELLLLPLSLFPPELFELEVNPVGVFFLVEVALCAEVEVEVECEVEVS